MDIPTERIAFLNFLFERYIKYYRKFNFEITEENKSLKWRLLRIEKAINFVKQDLDYKPGTCIECGDPINPERLKVEPESIWCPKCVEEHERKTKHRGGHWCVPNSH